MWLFIDGFPIEIKIQKMNLYEESKTTKFGMEKTRNFFYLMIILLT